MMRSTGDMAFSARPIPHPGTSVKRAASNKWVELLERVGYVARGVLYIVMGSLALGLALGFGGKATDQSGSLATLAGGGFGKIMLVVFVAGLAAYSLWGFVRAIFDPLHRGDDGPGIADRLGFAWSGLAYAGLVLFALELLTGTARTSSQDGTQSTITKVLAQPAGEWAVMGIGLVSIAAGLGQLFETFKARFIKDLKREEMSKAEQDFVIGLGRLGYLARGITFTLVGWFVLQAGMQHDASKVKGFAGTLMFLLGQPYGHLLLGLVALGFVALGLHSLAAARWMRLLGSRQ
jgi:hypothetical protein